MKALKIDHDKYLCDLCSFRVSNEDRSDIFQFEIINKNISRKSIDGLSNDIKLLYVAITRAKQGFLIFDEATDSVKSSPRTIVDKIFEDCNVAVKLSTSNYSDESISYFEEHYRPEQEKIELRKKAQMLMSSGSYEIAERLFNASGDFILARHCKCMQKVKSIEQSLVEFNATVYASTKKPSPKIIAEVIGEANKNITEIAKIYEEIGCHSEAAQCHFAVGDIQAAMEQYSLAGDEHQVGLCKQMLGDYVTLLEDQHLESENLPLYIKSMIKARRSITHLVEKYGLDNESFDEKAKAVYVMQSLEEIEEELVFERIDHSLQEEAPAEQKEGIHLLKIDSNDSRESFKNLSENTDEIWNVISDKISKSDTFELVKSYISNESTEKNIDVIIDNVSRISVHSPVDSHSLISELKRRYNKFRKYLEDQISSDHNAKAYKQYNEEDDQARFVILLFNICLMFGKVDLALDIVKESSDLFTPNETHSLISCKVLSLRDIPKGQKTLGMFGLIDCAARLKLGVDSFIRQFLPQIIKADLCDIAYDMATEENTFEILACLVSDCKFEEIDTAKRIGESHLAYFRTVDDSHLEEEIMASSEEEILTNLTENIEILEDTFMSGYKIGVLLYRLLKLSNGSNSMILKLEENAQTIVFQCIESFSPRTASCSLFKRGLNAAFGFLKMPPSTCLGEHICITKAGLKAFSSLSFPEFPSPTSKNSSADLYALNGYPLPSGLSIGLPSYLKEFDPDSMPFDVVCDELFPLLLAKGNIEYCKDYEVFEELIEIEESIKSGRIGDVLRKVCTVLQERAHRVEGWLTARVALALIAAEVAGNKEIQVPAMARDWLKTIDWIEDRGGELYYDKDRLEVIDSGLEQEGLKGLLRRFEGKLNELLFRDIFNEAEIWTRLVLSILSDNKVDLEKHSLINIKPVSQVPPPHDQIEITNKFSEILNCTQLTGKEYSELNIQAKNLLTYIQVN